MSYHVLGVLRTGRMDTARRDRGWAGYQGTFIILSCGLENSPPCLEIPFFQGRIDLLAIYGDTQGGGGVMTRASDLSLLQPDSAA